MYTELQDSFNNDVALAPHCPLGPISLASALQVDFCSSNAVIQESSLGIHYNQRFDLLDYVLNKEDFELHNGYINLFTRPGLGVDVNEELVSENAKIGHDRVNPVRRNDRGDLMEW